MKNILAGLILVLFAVTSCSDSSKNPLYDEVMKIHDDVMPKVADISKLSRQLKKERKEIADSIKLEIYDTNIQRLTKAEEAMYDWMRAFKLPEDEAKVEAYLREEKVKIQEVSDMMLSSIDEAKKLIDEPKN
jgi:flagellin-specific chaperone FliS